MQSVALRLIVDREREIEIFKPQEYWSVSATFEEDGQRFTARLAQLDGKKIDRLTIGNQRRRRRGQGGGRSRAGSPSRRSRPSRSRRNPPPPFTTSTLQQEAARKLGFAASHTMRVAQGLYEDGLITYMRTDGVDMAPEAVSAARRAIAEPLRCRLRARQAAPISEQDQECAGSARGDPADRFRPSARGVAATTRGSTSWSTTARWPARWPRRGSSGRRSS